MKILGIIPARGGSKRLPRKNLADFGGKPLVKRALDTAIKSGVFDHLWVSSEDDEIGTIAGEHWWRRDPDLAKDTSPTLPVVLDVLSGHKVDVVITMQCTSPFTIEDDIKSALTILIDNNADSVISTTEAPSDLAFQVRWANRLEKIPRIVVPNGAIYIATSEILNSGGDWYSGRLYGYQMPKQRSLDIDTHTDLQLAQLVLKNGLAA